jgi:hypothetical protein
VVSAGGLFDPFQSHRLWSLWDIMRQFNASRFLSFSMIGGMTQGWEDLDGRLPARMASKVMREGSVATFLKA